METQPVKYKSPIISIFGHVDAGKTSLIDAIKNTNKASSESGGITQSIGSYFINIDDIEQQIDYQLYGKAEEENIIDSTINNSIQKVNKEEGVLDSLYKNQKISCIFP